MTARERMLAGDLYNALDPELVEARAHARALLARFNTTGDRPALTALTALFGLLADGRHQCSRERRLAGTRGPRDAEQEPPARRVDRRE